MIKSVFTAHLTELDKQDLTLLFNERSLGLLSSENKANFVLTATRDVHMVTGFSNQSHYYDPRFNKDRIRLWNQAFKEMQAYGIKAFPKFIEDHHIYAEYLYIFSAEIFIGWQDRKNGLYLWRNHELYRLQPTVMPANIFDQDWMQHADFYSFIPRSGDVVFSISERVFSRLDGKKIDMLFSGKDKLAGVISEIIDLFRVYNDSADLTWFGFEVERLDKNIFKYSDQSRLKRISDFTRLINSSRVSKVRDGQKLIPAPRSYKHVEDMTGKTLEQARRRTNHNTSSLKSNSPGLGREGQLNRDLLKRPSPQNNREVRRNNIKKLEKRVSDRDRFWDDIRSYSFEPVIKNFKKTVSNLFNLIPEKPLLSKMMASSIMLVLIVFIFLVGRAIGSKSSIEVEPVVESSSFETRLMDKNDKVKPPDSALLEVDLTIKANNLQVRQEASPDSAIVATVQRGAKVTQLSEPDNGWVYVRLADGKTFGYVYADSLFAKEE